MMVAADPPVANQCAVSGYSLGQQEIIKFVETNQKIVVCMVDRNHGHLLQAIPQVCLM